jgi:quercetin dioxygenase-like cupin family protein
MKIVHYEEVEAKEVEGGSKVKMKWLNTAGSENFAVRHFEFEPGGYSPLHSHPWEHEMFILEGQGSVVGEKETKTVVAGNAISIPAGETHQVRNTSEKTLKLLCMIPK